MMQDDRKAKFSRRLCGAFARIGEYVAAIENHKFRHAATRILGRLSILQSCKQVPGSNVLGFFIAMQGMLAEK